jgi:hypothetical protein
VLWLCFGFGLTIFLPVRSSLYAVFPSVGSAIAAALLVSAMWPNVNNRARITLTAVALVLPLALLPVYRARGDRWVSSAQLSDSVLNQLTPLAARQAVQRIILRDHRTTRVNLANAIGPATREVAELIWARPLTLEIEAPADRKPRAVRPDEIVMALDPSTGLLMPVGPD